MDKPTPRLRFAILATDVALFTIRDGKLLVRLIHVERPPYFPDNVGMPGGLIDPSETAEECALRLIRDRGGIAPGKVHVEQLATFSKVDRDPRGRVVAVAYLAVVPWEKLSAEEQSDTKKAFWRPISFAKGLAYDHDEMFKIALERLRSRIEYTTIVQKILPHEFTLTDLERAYSEILGHNLDKRNFRKKILKLGILKPAKEKKARGRFRPAQLYSFASAKVDELALL